MLNPNFDEKALNFRRWSDFVSEAANAGYITVEERDRQPIIYPAQKGDTSQSAQRRAFNLLVDVLSELDEGKTPEYHDYATVSSRLKERKVDFKGLGMRRFKEFVQAAEARGLVESRSEGLRRYVRRVPPAPKKRSGRRRR